MKSKRSLIVAQRLYVYSVSYTASMGFAKAAILLEWKRIFVPRGTRDAFFWTAMALLVINVLLYMSVEIVVICSCVPPRKFWYPFIAGPCVNRRIVDTTAGSFNLATDIAIFLLPQRKIWSLRLSTSRKIGLAIVFSFGLVYVDIFFPSLSKDGSQVELDANKTQVMRCCHRPHTCHCRSCLPDPRRRHGRHDVHGVPSAPMVPR